MPKIILPLFFLPIIIVCYLKLVPVSELIKGNILTKYSLYCTISPNGYINLFYKIDKDSFHLVYDEKEDLVENSNDNKGNINKLGYLNSDKEYLILSTKIYYINGNNNTEIFMGDGDDFFILNNKDCIIIDYRISFGKLKYYLSLEYLTYPYNSDNNIPFLLTDVLIKHYEIIEVSDAVLFFFLLDAQAISNPLELYILDKNTKKLSKEKTLHEEITGFTLINLKTASDDFIYCISELFESTRCFKVKYENKKLTIEKSINVFTWECILTKDFRQFRKNYALLDEGKIAIICPSDYNIYLTLFQYKDNNLILGDIVNKELISFTSYTVKIQNTFLIYNLNKGLVLYYIMEYSKNYTYAAYKIYIEESCSSFDILTTESKETNISFFNYITGGINDLKPSFMITEIDPKITLFNNNKRIIAGTTAFNSSDTFTFISQFSETPLIIKFKNTKSDYSCRAIINIFYYKIEIKDKFYKCVRSPNISIVNNITNHDLDKKYDINKDKNFYFTVEYINNVREVDLIYNLIYKNTNIIFRCQKKSYYSKSIECKIPTDFDLFPPNSIKYEYNIYSYLSCLNPIYIGNVKVEDPYLIEIIKADNLIEKSQNIDKTYDASQRIKEFSINMINYYYWFPSFAYCDDEYIKSGECCKEEILTDWEIISYKKYILGFDYFMDSMGFKFDFLKIKKRIAEINQLNEEEIDLDLLLDYEIFKYVILKSKKFKKYVITFAGSNTFGTDISKIMFSEFVEYENDINIKVNKFFYLIFNLTKNDILAETILKDMKKNKEYQIIFTGHFLGGAVSTLASYYSIKNNLIENEPILITFGQPRVGNENFARDYMKIISKVFRIVRYDDSATMMPPINKQDDVEVNEMYKTIENIYNIFTLKDVPGTFTDMLGIIKLGGFDLKNDFVKDFLKGNLKGDLIGVLFEIIDVFYDKIATQFSNLIPYGYCHIGGLYVLNEDSNKFYHCKDVYNEEITSPYCKNRDIQYGHYDNLVKERNFYFTDRQNPMERCQAFKYGERFLLYP